MRWYGAKRGVAEGTMNVDHIQFYVDDAQRWADWFVQVFQFQIAGAAIANHTQTVIVQAGNIRFVLRSPLSDRSPLASYQRRHPPGVVDVAFQVDSLDRAIARAQAHGATLLRAPQTYTSPMGQVRWAQYQGWGDLCHTLVERRGLTSWPMLFFNESSSLRDERLCGVSVEELHGVSSKASSAQVTQIDHVVLNVARGDLQHAITQYENWFGFERRQSFTIQTPHSGLHSQVLVHPAGTAQLPINEPTSATSQIQEFLSINRGAGIQHIALETLDIVRTIADLRQRGLSFIPVPSTYYDQLQHRHDCTLSASQLRAIAQAEILVDWQADAADAVLWQTFTQPIFGMPTFFFEIIQRRTQTRNSAPALGSLCSLPRETLCDRCAQGFGEGNFQALFEAIEREQMSRTTLVQPTPPL